MKESVLFIIFSLESGGTQKMMVNVINHLEIDQKKVLFIYNDRGNNKYEKNLNLSIEKYKLNHSNSVFGYIKKIHYLIKIIKNENIRIIMSFSSQGSLLGILARIFFPFRKVKIINRMVSFDNKLFTQKTKNGFKNKIWDKVLKVFIYKRVDKIVCQTETMKNELIDNYPVTADKSIVINNYLDLNKIKTSKNEKVDFGYRYLVLIGHLSEEKNITGLIEAFKEISDKIDVNLIILGDGHMRSDLQKLILSYKLEKRIFLKGFVDNPFMYIAHAEIFIQNSLYEGLSNVLLEALACEVPIIVTDYPGAKEVISHGENGYIIPKNDNGALSKAILELLNNKTLSDHLRSNTLSSAKKYAGSIEQYQSLIKKII